MATALTQNGPTDNRQVRNRSQSNDLNEDLRQEIRDLRAQLQDLQEFIAKTVPEKEEIKDGRNISYFLAENVSVVGLREALTLNHTPVKVVWIILILGGFAATVYYIFNNTYEFLNKEPTTKVSFQRSTTYDFPPLILCPPWFFDKRSKVNLSANAIRYSLGYANLIDTYFPVDTLESFIPDFTTVISNNENSSALAPIVLAALEGGRDEFRRFYESNNFSSIEEYYNALATDIFYDTAEKNSSLYVEECTGCNQSHPPEKTIFSNAVCYVFHLNKATPKSADEPVYIRMNNTEDTNGIIPRSTNDWLMDFMSNVGPKGPSIPLKPYYSYNVKLSAQRMIQLVNASNCVDTEAKALRA